jgi:hypothetical protein
VQREHEGLASSLHRLQSEPWKLADPVSETFGRGALTVPELDSELTADGTSSLKKLAVLCATAAQ